MGNVPGIVCLYHMTDKDNVFEQLQHNTQSRVLLNITKLVCIRNFISSNLNKAVLYWVLFRMYNQCSLYAYGLYVYMF